MFLVASRASLLRLPRAPRWLRVAMSGAFGRLRSSLAADLLPVCCYRRRAPAADSLLYEALRLLAGFALFKARIARTHHAHGTIRFRRSLDCHRRRCLEAARHTRRTHTAADAEAARRAAGTTRAAVARRLCVQRAVRDRRLLDVRRRHRAEVVRRLQAAQPRELVDLVELLA